MPKISPTSDSLLRSGSSPSSTARPRFHKTTSCFPSRLDLQALSQLQAFFAMFIKEAWFWRGFQSAIFYYISCAPCTKVLDQRKKKQNAARAKAEKLARKAAHAQMEENGDQPEYDHPLPSSTNPFWDEDIQLGPGPPPKRRNNRHAGGSEGQGKERGSKEKGRKSGSLEMAKVNGLAPAAKGEDGSNSSKGTRGSEATDTPMKEVPQIATPDNSDTDWNRRRYQREDELLWGLDDEGDELNEGSQLSRIKKSTRGQSKYNYARNPAVNDLHPPVVSTAPTSRSETQWMLQPPPRAKIMEGKERQNRSRSGTGSTRSSRASSKRAGLGRQLGNRALESMMVRSFGELTPTPTHLAIGGVGMSRSRGSSNQSLASGQRHDRDITPTPQGQPSPNSLQPSRSSSQRKAAPPPITLDKDPSFLSPSTTRPGLQTIPSTSLMKPHSNVKDQIYEGKGPTSSPLNSSESAVSHSEKDTTGRTPIPANALQELVIPPSRNQINRSSSLNARNDKKDQEGVDAIDHAVPFPGAERGWGCPLGDGLDGGGKDGISIDENQWLGEEYRHRHRWSMDF